MGMGLWQGQDHVQDANDHSQLMHLDLGVTTLHLLAQHKGMKCQRI